MTEQNDTTRIPLVYGGVAIRDRGEMLSLTDMWKAAGADPTKAPAQWQRLPQAAEFIEHVGLIVGKSHNNLVETRKRAGTFAHWQIGIAYAKYLSHDFHMWGNQAIREKMEGRAAAVPALPAEVLDQIERSFGIVRAMIHKVTEIEKSLPVLVESLVDPMLNARLAAQNLMIRHSRTAGQIWADYNLPRLKNAPTWLGNRLSKMGCQVGGNGRAEIGGRLSRVYDPDKVAFCMNNGLLQTAKAYATERMGQRRLNLIGGGK